MSASVETQAQVIAAPSLRRENIPLAILCIIASGAVFNCANAASKWLGTITFRCARDRR